MRVRLIRKGKNLTLNSAPAAPTTPAQLAKVDKDKATWEARKMHGRHLPVLACSRCSISSNCPKFKAGYECAYLPYLNSHKVESTDDLLKYMKLMVGNSMKRAQMMSIVESASGGMPSLETSEALDTAFRQLKELHGVMKAEIPDDTLEIEADSSIVGSLFGGMKMKRVMDDTETMFRNDPMLSLPAEVKRSDSDPVQQVSVAHLSTQELIKDMLLSPTGKDKMGLNGPAMPAVRVGSLGD